LKAWGPVPPSFCGSQIKIHHLSSWYSDLDKKNSPQFQKKKKKKKINTDLVPRERDVKEPDRRGPASGSKLLDIGLGTARNGATRRKLKKPGPLGDGNGGQSGQRGKKKFHDLRKKKKKNDLLFLVFFTCYGYVRVVSSFSGHLSISPNPHLSIYLSIFPVLHMARCTSSLSISSQRASRSATGVSPGAGRRGTGPRLSSTWPIDVTSLVTCGALVLYSANAVVR
jgi:hypothetical protein